MNTNLTTTIHFSHLTRYILGKEPIGKDAKLLTVNDWS